MRRSLIAFASLVALAALPIGAAAQSIHLVPVDGAHWRAGAGLPENHGPALGLVQDVVAAGHTEVGLLKGLSGAPGSALTGLAFASSTPSGIDPCWKIYITEGDGSVRVVHLTLDSARRSPPPIGDTPPPVGDFAPFVMWTWHLQLPADSTIDQISLQVDAGQLPPPTGDRVAFDGFALNGISLAKP